ncbi:MAG: DUF4097 family beta strand repeat-containing protein [Gemmatimonadota bacterium]|jgi:hypothetical protein
MMGRTHAGLLAAVLTLVVAAPLEARQSWQLADQEWCEDSRGGGSSERLCEVRSSTLSATDGVAVNAGANGAVEVEAWDRDEIEVVTRVQARARSAARAQEILDAVDVSWDDGRLEADGPRTGRRESWTVSYRLRVPRSTDLRLRTTNGGISVAGVSGDIDVRAVNGGVSFAGLSGDVRGRTTNGGLTVELTDTSWDGAGLDLETTNGGVRMSVPEQYSAELELSTRNGRIDLDFPATVQGRMGRSLRTTLGDGGPTIRAATTNGSVEVSRR